MRPFRWALLSHYGGRVDIEDVIDLGVDDRAALIADLTRRIDSEDRGH